MVRRVIACAGGVAAQPQRQRKKKPVELLPHEPKHALREVESPLSCRGPRLEMYNRDAGTRVYKTGAAPCLAKIESAVERTCMAPRAVAVAPVALQ